MSEIAKQIEDAPRFKQDFYYWRILATGISFLSFGVGGLLIRLIIFPFLRILPGNKSQHITRCRWVIHKVFAYFVALMKGLGVLTYEIHGHEKLNARGQLVIANHPSLIDVVLLISVIKNTNCIVKDSLFKNPTTRGPVTGAGYISNGNPEQLISDCVTSLKNSDSLVVFPEGTRGKVGQPLKFKRGAALIAMHSNARVTPVTITCNPPTLAKGSKWYEVPFKRVHFVLRVGEDLQFDTSDTNIPHTTHARRLTQFWQAYFSKEINHDQS